MLLSMENVESLSLKQIFQGFLLFLRTLSFARQW